MNQLVARLRLDLLWFYDIPILSESAFEPDVSEYLGTVSFVKLPDLVEETLALWQSLSAGNSSMHSVTHYEKRLEVMGKREDNFRKVIRVVLGKDYGEDGILEGKSF